MGDILKKHVEVGGKGKKAHHVDTENISLHFNWSKKCLTEQQRWKGSPFLTQTCMGVAMAWVTYTGAPPSTWADTREPIQSKNVTQAHPSMPFIPKYSIVPDTHAQNQMKEKKSNSTNPQKELSPNSIDSTRVQLCSTKRYASILLDVFQL